FRRTAKCVLVTHGYEHDAADYGNDDHPNFPQRRYENDLVLADIVMPFMDGVTHARTLRKMDPTVRIVLSTGRDEDCQNAEVMALHLTGCLAKPDTGATVLTTLGHALGASP